MKLGLFSRKDRGSAMIAISFVIMIIAVLGVVYSMTTLSTHRLTLDYRNVDMAVAHAQGGVEYALHEIGHRDEAAPPTEGVAFARLITLNGMEIKVNSAIRESITFQGVEYPILVMIESQATVGNVTRSVRAIVHNYTAEFHEIYKLAIYAGNVDGRDFTFQLTGKSGSADRIRGDVHINGDFEFSLNALANWDARYKHNAQFDVYNMTNAGVIVPIPDGSNVGDIPVPDLHSMGYQDANRRYREWGTPEEKSSGRDIVDVGEAYAHYTPFNIKISREGGTYSGGPGPSYNEWNSSAKSLPDAALANFFQYDYQNHYVKSFNSTDDTKIDATKNYYLGARNTGDATHYGVNGVYGGGHSVITINQEQNNKVYYINGNLWADSDGSNHIFFVPGPGVDKLNITIVVNGNFYIGDQIFTVKYDTSEINGGTGGYTAFNLLDPDSGVAIIAMCDGETYDDANKNGKYDLGETIIGRTEPNTPVPAANNPASGAGAQYRGRMEGSGNIVFGDTIDGPVGAVETFLYAENNFIDITSSGSDQASFVYGNMTAGNRVYLKRNYADWQTVGAVSGPPAGWVLIGTYYYPPGTTDTSDFFKCDRRWKSGTLYTRKHNPLKVTLDQRIADGTLVPPLLPEASGIEEGTLVPLAMQVIDGPVLAESWVQDPP